MTKLRCAIVEDEALAQELLEKYVRRVPSLELVGTFDDAVSAFESLPALRPDLIFLDINMPEVTGIEFLRAYPAPHPAVVITTANPNHALEGFDWGVTDYLLKPIPFDRFLKSVGRFRERLHGALPVPAAEIPSEKPADGASVVEERDFVYFRTDKKMEQVRYDEIVRVESLGDYVKVFLDDRVILTLVTMKKIADTLPSDRFLRIHRSALVPLRHIRSVEGNTLRLSDGHELVIGPNYRDEVFAALKKWLII